MSQLIQMRQRIKAIETIKKITHAMRLISMSTHSRLQGPRKHLHDYKAELHNIFGRVSNAAPAWNHDILMPQQPDGDTLAILIGSQKGLCGNFNTHLYFYFERQLAQARRQNIKIITIGKKAGEFAKVGYGTIIAKYDDFGVTSLTSISKAIADHIVHSKNPYSSVTVYNNYPKTFFHQKPQAEILIPFSQKSEASATIDYIWKVSPAKILDTLAYQLIQVSLQEHLLESLIAEQAARFVAMDNSTRNAETLLDTMKLNYNKLRQTKITRELTDLAASF